MGGLRQMTFLERLIFFLMPLSIRLRSVINLTEHDQELRRSQALLKIPTYQLRLAIKTEFFNDFVQKWV